MASRVIVLACALALSGCTAFGPLFGTSNSGTSRSSRAGAQDLVVDTGGLSVYLAMIEQLVDGDTLTQAAAFNDAEDDAAIAPTTGNRLRYALALSIPDHPGSDLEAGATRLRDLLASDLLPAERMLATMQLHNTEELMILEQSRGELEQRYDEAVAANDAETAAEVRRLLDENADLKIDNEALVKELRDATEMLDAITSIEESISERDDNAN
jgi:hypothetical protein